MGRPAGKGREPGGIARGPRGSARGKGGPMASMGAAADSGADIIMAGMPGWCVGNIGMAVCPPTNTAGAAAGSGMCWGMVDRPCAVVVTAWGGITAVAAAATAGGAVPVAAGAAVAAGGPVATLSKPGGGLRGRVRSCMASGSWRCWGCVTAGCRPCTPVG